MAVSGYTNCHNPAAHMIINVLFVLGNTVMTLTECLCQSTFNELVIQLALLLLGQKLHNGVQKIVLGQVSRIGEFRYIPLMIK